MAWHQGECPICKQEKLIGYVVCLRLEICVDCFLSWQSGELKIKVGLSSKFHLN